MTHTLIVVDMQNDFIDMALGTKEAVTIVPEVVKLIADASYDQVIATMDTHPENYLDTFEGRHLPVAHCIKPGTGWQLNQEVKAALDQRNAEIIEKPTFGSEQLMRQMKQEKPDEITLCGLCTDICVISNALLLRAALPETEIRVIAKACAGVTKEKHEAALMVMESCQIQVIK